MTKAEIIALLFLSNTDLSHLETIVDYVDQFDEAVRQVQAVLESRENSQR